jgi:hypothetical protein
MIRRKWADLHELEVGFCEVAAAAEKRLAGKSRSRVGHAVAEVQSGGCRPLPNRAYASIARCQ